MPKPDILTARQARFTLALWTSPTIQAAAQAVSISERTARRWVKLPKIVAALREQQAEALAAVTRRAVAEMPGALQTLVEIHQDDAVPPGPRVSAAKAVLESSLHFTEVVDWEQRISDLEQEVKNEH